MTVEEKANKYAEETILALYSDSELMQDFVQKQKKYAKVDFIAGYNEGQSNPKIMQLEWEDDVLFADIIVSGIYPLLFYRINIIDNTLHIGDMSQSFNTIEEAKAFAQDYFEACIKECLITE